MIFETTKTVGVPAERLWEVFAERYTHVEDWVWGVYASRPRAGVPNGNAPVLGRECQTSFGKHPFVETIESFDPDARSIAYSMTSKSLPPFLRRIENTWTFVAADAEYTEIRVKTNVTLIFPFNILMGPLMRRQMRSQLPGFIDDLTRFAKTGEPAPRKRDFDSGPKAEKARKAFV